jgi:histidine triad (HIT) family protein
MEECLFCKIANGQIPSRKVYEDKYVIAILDINPANRGHCLVISKKHYENVYDADDDDLQKMIVVAKTLAKRVKERLNAVGVNILQNNGRRAGQLVNHIHIHVIPRFDDDKVLITYQRSSLSDADFEEMQKILGQDKTAEERMAAGWGVNI